MENTSPRELPVLVFGDQTDVFYPTIKLLYSQASVSPWLRLFLQSATSTLKEEIDALEPKLRDGFGGNFTDLLHLAERFRESSDAEGLASTVLVTIMRTSVLVQYIESNPAILSLNKCSICIAAACRGLLNATALMSAYDMPSLCSARLDTIQMARRLIEVVAARSRSVQEGPGYWGWLVLETDATKLQSILNSYHKGKNTIEHRKLKLARTGLKNAWHTVIRPPIVLEHFFSTCPLVQNLPKSKLQVTGLVHVISDITQAKVDYIARGMTAVIPILKMPPRANIQLVSLGEGGLLSTPT
ncbi:polyketide synthase [Colletotrichum tofieldiae]|uniref:Polyketide synthase n=1 Tax=Colletotrichum tofieldiae TaxID=708197 RepID=A0A166NXI3_9PEZI|nr:polyketide synthase [Colletotrichum tofieldiae]